MSSRSVQRQGSTILLLFFALNPLAEAGSSLDPVTNFCRRIGHSSLLKNGSLYINGGLETYVDLGPDGQQDWSTITSGINTDLITVDMTSSWDWKTNVSISRTNKEESGTVAGMTFPVNVHDGSLWGGQDDATTLYSFGGTTSGFNESYPSFEIPPTTEYGLWTYDLQQEIWAAVNTLETGITIPSWGANAESPTHGLGFYVGGQIDSGTANSTQSLGNDTVGLGGMIVLDMTSNNVKNVTVPSDVKSNRQGAGMVYVDTFGDSGLLVLIGGQTADGLLSMDQIAVFDVSTVDLNDVSTSNAQKNVWYTQTATGNAPDPRTDFCLISAPAQDNSSANIYLYGGRSNGTIFDDVYVLSLPSFTWVNVFQGKDARWSITCHFVPPRQMITVGGGGKSTNISSDCDWETKSLAVMDLSTINTNGSGWGSVFDAAAPPYQVPDLVVAKIGGTPSGGATKTQPDDGWSNSALGQVFALKAVSSTTNSTTPSPSSTTPATPPLATSSGHHSSGLSDGAIAGIVIAAVAGVSIIGAAAIYFRTRAQHRRQAMTPGVPEKDGLPTHGRISSQVAELGDAPKPAELPSRDGHSVVAEREAGTVPTGDHENIPASQAPVEME